MRFDTQGTPNEALVAVLLEKEQKQGVRRMRVSGNRSLAGFKDQQVDHKKKRDKKDKPVLSDDHTFTEKKPLPKGSDKK